MAEPPAGTAASLPKAAPPKPAPRRPGRLRRRPGEAEALAPALLIIDLLRSALADAPARGQVHPDAATDAGVELLSIMHGGFARDFATADGQRVI